MEQIPYRSPSPSLSPPPPLLPGDGRLLEFRRAPGRSEPSAAQSQVGQRQAGQLPAGQPPIGQAQAGQPPAVEPLAVEPLAVEPLWRELAGARIRERRSALDRTLAEVADRAGISPQYLSEVERGLKDPSSEMLASICGALGLTLTDLLRHSFIRLQSSTAIRPGFHGPVLLAS